MAGRACWSTTSPIHLRVRGLVLELLDQPDDARTWDGEGRQLARKIYAVDIVTQQYEALYERLLERPSTTPLLHQLVTAPA